MNIREFVKEFKESTAETLAGSGKMPRGKSLTMPIRAMTTIQKQYGSS